jgi:Collagen triple helix repeat (20 copies)
MNKLAALLAITLIAAPTIALAAMAGANTVNSAAIVDGSVATADLANLAVTTAKIANSAVSTTQLANGAVTAAKLGITCPTGQYLQFNGTWGCSVGTAGPQGPAGLAGPQGIPGVAGPAGLAGLAGPQGIQGVAGQQGLKGDTGASGTQGPAGKGASYAQVIVVAQNGTGDFSDPVAAINSITDASATKPYLIKVMPGVYNIGNLGISNMVLKSYIDIEGSGEGVTKIVGSVNDVNYFASNYTPIKAVAEVSSGSTNIEIRSISFIADGLALNPRGARGAASALHLNDGSSVKLSHVSLSALNSSGPTFGVSGFDNTSLTMKDTTIFSGVTCENYGKISGFTDAYGIAFAHDALASIGAGGLDATNTNVEVSDSSISAVGIEFQYIMQGAARGYIRGSVVKGLQACGFGNSGTYLLNSDKSFGVAYTQIMTDNSNNYGLITGVHGGKCIGNYDVNFAPIPCP